MKIAINNYAFHWAYPEILADELGLFEEWGIKVDWYDATPSGVVGKGAMYTDLLRSRLTDVYHAGEWACINRVLKSPESWIVAKSVPGRETLNSTFSLFARNDMGITKAKDLADRRVAVEEGTGAYYTTMADLERHLPRDKIQLIQIGEPHRRLLSLLSGEVDSASLVGPWVDIGEALGLRMILRTTRRNPTTSVVRKDTKPEPLRRYFRAVNLAIGRINAAPNRFKKSFLSRLKRILDEMPEEISARSPSLERRIIVPKWRPWVRYTRSDFRVTYAWLVARGLAPESHAIEDVVARYSPDIFS